MLAVQTRLAGIDYRSRTEAEWAAMLAAHKVRFDYEPINFRFSFVAPNDWGGYSSHYIPDFWLPDLGLWLEVKPHRPNLIEYRKAALLAECTGSGVLITTGGPGFDELVLVKDLRRVESVSTIAAPPLDQAPLKLNVAILTDAQFFGRCSPCSEHLSQLPTPRVKDGLARADPVHRDHAPTRTKAEIGSAYGSTMRAVEHFARTPAAPTETVTMVEPSRWHFRSFTE